jgi:nucleotide-binding universal stress UspA family protein
MKKILVPTDFSEHAEYALRVAAQIAKKVNAEIFLLHMLELPSQMSDMTTKGAEGPEIIFAIKKVREQFQVAKEKPYLEGIPITEAVQFAKAFEGIIESSKKNAIDLIVMGSHGVSGFEEMFVGSNTEKVVRTSEIPVLVVKSDVQIASLKKLVFASDFSSEIEDAFPKALNFAEMLGVELHMLMVNTPNNFKTTAASEALMADFASRYGLANQVSLHTYNDENLEAGILNFTDKINADLIGICTHGRTGLSHFFNGSLSEDVVNHSKKAVVTFKI